MIPVLPELENREQWLAFLRRERPYAQVRKPSCRIDLQSTYLKITLVNEVNASPLRFTLGSRSSVEPIWQLISGCQWSLTEMIEGLGASDFNTNARDNRISGWSPDLSVRRSFPRESGLFSGNDLGVFKKHHSDSIPSDISSVISRLAWGKYTQLSKNYSACSAITALSEQREHWQITQLSESSLRLTHPERDSIEISFAPSPFAPSLR